MRVKLRQEKLAENLAQRQISLNHWARKIGLSHGHLSDLVNGKRRYPRPATRKKLLEALAIDFDDLNLTINNKPLELVGYKMKEEWFFDSNMQMSNTRIIGLCPIVKDAKEG